MSDLYPGKVINVIAESQLENRLIKLASRHKINGYTIMEARGNGSSGIQSGVLDVESNILFLIIVSPARADAIMAELAGWIEQGYHLVTFVSDTQILRPQKFG
jgi:hypothetical protein